MAEYSVSRDKMYRLRKLGKITFYKIDDLKTGTSYVKRSDLDALFCVAS